MEKGTYGYGKKKLRAAILKTAVCFAVVFGAVLAGVLIFGNKKNVFTVLGIVMVLPSANFLVNLIVRLRGKYVDEKMWKRFSERTEGLIIAADLILTANQKNIPVPLMVFAESGMLAYIPASAKENSKVLQMDLNTLCQAAGLTHRIQVFTDPEQFLKRVGSVHPAESDSVRERLSEERKELLLYSM